MALKVRISVGTEFEVILMAFNIYYHAILMV